MRPGSVAASHAGFDAAGRPATQPRVDRRQRRGASNWSLSQCGTISVVLLGLLALCAPRVAHAELIATMTFYSVNSNFDASDCELLDAYVTQSLLDKNVPIDFSNPAVYRTNCTYTSYSGRVRSVLTYYPTFDGLSALENLVTYAQALRDELLWRSWVLLVGPGCGAEAFYTDPAVITGLTQGIAVCTNNPTSTVLPPTAGTPCTYFLSQQLCSPPPPPPVPSLPPGLSPPRLPPFPPAPPSPTPPTPPSPPNPPRPPRPPFPPGLGPCILVSKAIRPTNWTNITSCNQLVSAMAGFYAYNAQMQAGFPFRCIDDGSTNGQMLVVGTAATREDALIIQGNFQQRQLIGATVKMLGGMTCDSAMILEGSTCGVYVRYDSLGQPDLFACFPPPPPSPPPPSPPPTPPPSPTPPSPSPPPRPPNPPPPSPSPPPPSPPSPAPPPPPSPDPPPPSPSAPPPSPPPPTFLQLEITNPDPNAIFLMNCTSLRIAFETSLLAMGQTPLSPVSCTVGYITGVTTLRVQLKDAETAATAGFALRGFLPTFVTVGQLPCNSVIRESVSTSMFYMELSCFGQPVLCCPGPPSPPAGPPTPPSPRPPPPPRPSPPPPSPMPSRPIQAVFMSPPPGLSPSPPPRPPPPRPPPRPPPAPPPPPPKRRRPKAVRG